MALPFLTGKFLFPAEDVVAAADWILQIDTDQDIQVLAPIYRGPAGKLERCLFGTVFRLGDIAFPPMWRSQVGEGQARSNLAG